MKSTTTIVTVADIDVDKLTVGTMFNHGSVLFIAGSANLLVTGKMFLGNSGDSGNTLETASFVISTPIRTSVLHPIRFSSISAMSGAGGSIQLS